MPVRLRSRRRTEQDDAPVVLPNVCPQCGGAGYLDHINLVRETKTQSCQECNFRWESAID